MDNEHFTRRIYSKAMGESNNLINLRDMNNSALGKGYVEAVRKVHPDNIQSFVLNSAEVVQYFAGASEPTFAQLLSKVRKINCRNDQLLRLL